MAVETTISSSYAFDAANRLITVNGQAVSFDADGNTLTDASGRTSTWDSQNRLTHCTKGGVTSTYTYGADGLRRSSTVNGTTTYYVYDSTMLVREMQKNAQGILQSTATYLCGPRGPEYRRDDVHSEGTYTDGTGTHPAGKTRWYVYDGLGSVVGEVDPSGNLTTTGKYDVYGAKRAGGTGTATSRQGFVGSLGHITDDTGLVYMRARYYDPQTGRFISEDSKQSGTNWFSYCDNDPTDKRDATGKEGFDAEFYQEFYDLIEKYYEAAKQAGMWNAAGVDARALANAMQTKIDLGDLASTQGALEKRDLAGAAAGNATGMEAFYRGQMYEYRTEMAILFLDRADEAGMEDGMDFAMKLFQGM